MPIIRTAPASNFTIYSNDLIGNSLPPVAKTVLLYLLSKPHDWQPKPHDIRKQLCLSAYAVKKALRLLCQAGYAAYDRLKSGHTIWRIFSTPEKAYSPAIPPQVEKPQVENRPVLQRTETEQILKQPLATPTPPIIDAIVEPVVVVSSDDLVYPTQLTPVQIKAAKHIVKKLKEPAIAQDVLFALSYALTSGKIKCAPAYLSGLVNRANNDTFEPVTNNTGSVLETAAGRAERTRRQLEAARSVKVDNASFFEELKARFGSKASKAIPV